MQTPSLKARLAEGKPLIGSFLAMNSPAVAEVMAHLGFDFLVIDSEHGLMGAETEAAMINAMKVGGTPAVIRVANNDQTILKRALDAGPAGVMVPMIASAEDAAHAVSYCLYPPAGVRGVGAGHACLYGVDVPGYPMRANDEILKILQIEHIDAVDNIDAILSTPGVDLAFIGPTDLSCSMGLMGQPGHPDVQAAIATVAAAAKKRGVALGIYCFTPEEALKAAAEGFTFLSIGLDAGFLAAAVTQTLAGVREHLGR